jgi:uncharacterized protein YegL
MNERPGGALGGRPLHFIWLCDCSGSMCGQKIQALNTAIRESIPHMQDAARSNPGANVKVRAIKFADRAEWHIDNPVDVESFRWSDLGAGGVTAMGAALTKVAQQMKMPPMESRGLPPVLVLVSDGQPTDDFSSGLKALMDETWGIRAVRIAIAIGGDADLGVLQKFIGNGELRPLEAHNVEDLMTAVRWASTSVLQAASSPPSQVNASPASGSTLAVPLPQAPAMAPTGVW